MNNIDLERILTMIPFISMIVVLLLWYIRGYDGRFKTKAKLYTLPKDISPLDVGYLYKGEAKDKDVNSILLYLASKNYIRIEEIKNSFQIVKLKDYKGTNNDVKKFFRELFSKSDNVIEDELYDEFYHTTDEIKDRKNSSHTTQKFFYDNRYIVMMIDLLVVTCLFTTTAIVYVETYGNDINAGLVAIFLIAYLLTYFPFKSMNAITKYTTRVFALIAYFFILIVGFDLTSELLIINLLIYITLIITMNTIILFMPKRNKAGHQLYGQIKRFKNSIKKLDEDKLKELLEENKNYVADVFPYAYTLGLTRNLINLYSKVDNNLPKYVKMLEEKDVRKNYNFLKRVTNNIDRRYGEDRY